MYYDDIDYARKRLIGTLIRTKEGKPFIVSDIKAVRKEIFCEGPTDKNEEYICVPLKDVDLTPVPLGFINRKGKMLYVCRKPMRKDWKQGLSINSLVVYGGDKKEILLAHVIQAVLNKYPTVFSTIDFVRNNRNSSMAFSREFGLVNKEDKILLVYRKYPVGGLIKDQLILNPDKYFLDQHLAETLVQNGRN